MTARSATHLAPSGGAATASPGLSPPLARLLAVAPWKAASRILALGADVSPPAHALRARGHAVHEVAPAEGESALRDLAASSPGSFDAVLALGFVERLRWDRWALQQIHRTLREGGLLVLAVPDLFSLRSLADPRYVAAKLAKRFPRALRSRSATIAAGGGEPRAYPAARLRAMLERLGYEPLRWSALATPRAGSPARRWAWPPTHHLVLARRGPGPLDGPPGGRDPVALRRRFETEQRAFLLAREEWRRRVGRSDRAPEPLEPERLSGAPVLVLSPHPDDEIIGCGGTLLRLVRAGAKVTVLQATDGSASAALDDVPPELRRGIRLDEARAVAGAAGFEPTIFWREDNGAFRPRPELVARLRETLERLRPALVFTPFLADIHPDHLTLNRILAAALEDLPGPDPTVVGYEVWSLAPANLWCDVGDRMGEVERLLLLYETAMKVDDFVWMCATRNRYHSLALAGRDGHAEAFFATDPPRFRELVRGMPDGGAGSESR